MANKIKLDLQGLTVPEKFQLLRQVVLKLTGNATFPHPNPPLADLTTQADDLEAAYLKQQNDQQTAKTSTTDLHTQEGKTDASLNTLAGHVEEVSKGDKAKIESTGLNTRAPRTPTTSLAAPGNVSLTAGDNDGELDVGWDPVTGVVNYEVQVCDDPPTVDGWKFVKTTTKSSTTLPGLTSGAKKWVRIRAHGPKEITGPWSDPAVKRVP